MRKSTGTKADAKNCIGICESCGEVSATRAIGVGAASAGPGTPKVRKKVSVSARAFGKRYADSARRAAMWRCWVTGTGATSAMKSATSGAISWSAYGPCWPTTAVVLSAREREILILRTRKTARRTARRCKIAVGAVAHLERRALQDGAN